MKRSFDDVENMNRIVNGFPEIKEGIPYKILMANVPWEQGNTAIKKRKDELTLLTICILGCFCFKEWNDMFPLSHPIKLSQEDKRTGVSLEQKTILVRGNLQLVLGMYQKLFGTKISATDLKHWLSFLNNQPDFIKNQYQELMEDHAELLASNQKNQPRRDPYDRTYK